MRSILAVVVLATSIAAPLSAVASTRATFTNPTNTRHQVRPADVLVTFRNVTSQDRELVIGDQSFRVHNDAKITIAVPVGSVIRVYSQTNSKVNGQQLMQVSEADANSTVVLK
jgi:hypothetical protein